MKKLSRGQSGVELMMSYGWVVLLGVGAVVLLYQMDSFRPVACHKSTVGFSQVVPVDWAVYRDSNVVVLSAENWASGVVHVSNVSVSFGDVSCYEEYSVDIPPGGRGVFSVDCPAPGLESKFRLGDCFTMDVAFGYVNPGASLAYDSRGKLYGPIEEGMPVVTSSSTSSSSSSTAAPTTTVRPLMPPEVELVSPSPTSTSGSASSTASSVSSSSSSSSSTSSSSSSSMTSSTSSTSSTSTTITPVMCWAGGDYLDIPAAYMSKFCKCASGTYGYLFFDTDSYTNWGAPSNCGHPLQFVDSGDNLNWATVADPVCNPMAAYVVLCQNNRYYYTSPAYSYPPVNYSVYGHGKTCWEGSNRYLRQGTGAAHSSSASKFCKCAMGTYGSSQVNIHDDFDIHGAPVSTLASYTYCDGGDNMEWMTTKYIHLEHTAIDRVKCSDGNWYDTDATYVYP